MTEEAKSMLPAYGVYKHRQHLVKGFELRQALSDYATLSVRSNGESHLHPKHLAAEKAVKDWEKEDGFWNRQLDLYQDGSGVWTTLTRKGAPSQKNLGEGAAPRSKPGAKPTTTNKSQKDQPLMPDRGTWEGMDTLFKDVQLLHNSMDVGDYSGKGADDLKDEFTRAGALLLRLRKRLAEYTGRAAWLALVTNGKKSTKSGVETDTRRPSYEHIFEQYTDTERAGYDSFPTKGTVISKKNGSLDEIRENINTEWRSVDQDLEEAMESCDQDDPIVMQAFQKMLDFNKKCDDSADARNQVRHIIHNMLKYILVTPETNPVPAAFNGNMATCCFAWKAQVRSFDNQNGTKETGGALFLCIKPLDAEDHFMAGINDPLSSSAISRATKTRMKGDAIGRKEKKSKALTDGQAEKLKKLEKKEAIGKTDFTKQVLADTGRHYDALVGISVDDDEHKDTATRLVKDKCFATLEWRGFGAGAAGSVKREPALQLTLFDRNETYGWLRNATLIEGGSDGEAVQRTKLMALGTLLPPTSIIKGVIIDKDEKAAYNARMQPIDTEQLWDTIHSLYNKQRGKMPEAPSCENGIPTTFQLRVEGTANDGAILTMALGETKKLELCFLPEVGMTYAPKTVAEARAWGMRQHYVWEGVRACEVLKRGAHSAVTQAASQMSSRGKSVASYLPHIKDVPEIPIAPPAGASGETKDRIPPAGPRNRLIADNGLVDGNCKKLELQNGLLLYRFIQEALLCNVGVTTRGVPLVCQTDKPSRVAMLDQYYIRPHHRVTIGHFTKKKVHPIDCSDPDVSDQAESDESEEEAEEEENVPTKPTDGSDEGSDESEEEENVEVDEQWLEDFYADGGGVGGAAPVDAKTAADIQAVADRMLKEKKEVRSSKSAVPTFQDIHNQYVKRKPSETLPYATPMPHGTRAPLYGAHNTPSVLRNALMHHARYAMGA